MPRYTNTLVFPDVNLWLALTSESHPHFGSASEWYGELPPGTRLVFCRVTQMALLRLLTSKTVMEEDVCTTSEAWSIYDRWLEEGPALLMEEPHDMERRLRFTSKKFIKSPADWPDAYLATFAQSAGISLITFDRRLSQLADGSILLN